MSSENHMIVKWQNLKSLVFQIFKSVNVASDDAEITASNLIQADLRGVNTHGVVRLPIYTKRIKLGLVNPQPNIKVIKETESTAVVDGDFGLGQVIGFRAMKLAIEKAKNYGIACVGVRKSHHFGAAAYFTQMAVDQDMIGFCCSNSPPLMPAPGGAKKVIGNNPFSFAIPAEKEPPLVLDMACSLVAQGKITLALKKGEKIPLGWATDQNGIPTTDPAEALKGFLLPMGGHKGYSLAVIIDALAGVLTGAAFGEGVISIYGDLKNKQNSGHLFMAVNPEKFMDIIVFKRLIDSFIKEIKSSPLAEGTKEIFMPGEIEYRTMKNREIEGIPLPKAVIKELLNLAKDAELDGHFLLNV